MAYITKDIDEKLDYVFIRQVADNIVSLECTPTTGNTIVVESCLINTTPVVDTDGNSYPAGRAIILWLSGGTNNTTNSLQIKYTTTAGRILDEDVTVRCVKSY